MQMVGETDRTGTDGDLQARPGDVYRNHGVRLRDPPHPDAGGGLPQRRPRASHIADRRRGQEQTPTTMCYAGGIREFVTYINRNKTPIHDGVIYMAGTKEDAMAEVALQYNDSYNEIIVSFANNVHTPEGRHARGGVQAGPHQRPQRLRPEDEDPQGGREGHRRGLPGGPHLRHLRQAHRGPV